MTKRSSRHSRPPATSAAVVPSTRLAFVSAVAAALDRRCGVGAGERLVLAVSGGADSFALLLALTALARRSHRGYRLTVAHVNHHLRPGAGREAEMVGQAAERLGLPFALRDVHPKRERGNAASAARRLRYEALAEVAAETGSAAIVTAHHGTDQLETVLLALMRGAGPEGLAALAWRSERWGATVIRPLLDRTHEDCVDLCRRSGWTWAEDPSNRDEARRRNALRANLLPRLLELAPDLDRRIHRTTDLLREAAELVEREVARVFPDPRAGEFDRAALAAEGPLVIGAGLRRAAAVLGAPLDDLTHEVVRPAVDAIMDTDVRRPRRYHWPGRVTVAVRARVVALSRSAGRK